MVLKYTYMLAVYSTTNHDIFYQPRRLFVVRDRTSSSSIHICVTALVCISPIYLLLAKEHHTLGTLHGF